MAEFLFYLFAGIAVGCAALAVVQKNAINGALCLMLSLVGLAGLFVLLDAYLLAFVLLLVYAGAVVTLFLFIVMLLGPQPAPRRHRPLTLAGATLGGALLALGVYSLVSRASLAAAQPAEPVGAALKPYAQQLFTTYLLPVQIVGFLLLIAMIGVVVLARKLPPEPAAKPQNPGGAA